MVLRERREKKRERALPSRYYRASHGGRNCALRADRASGPRVGLRPRGANIRPCINRDPEATDQGALCVLADLLYANELGPRALGRRYARATVGQTVGDPVGCA